MSVGGKFNKYGTAGKGLTDEKCQEAYDMFAKQVADLLPLEQHDQNMLNEEDALIKFLIARKYDVGQSEKMLREYLKWRKEFGCESIFTTGTFDADIPIKYPAAFGGKDKEGNPLYIESANGKHLAELLKVQGPDKLFTWHIYLIERQRQIMKHWKSDRISIIIDAADVNLGIVTNSTALGFLKRIAAHDQAMYPEGMRFMFVINAPSVASGVWKMIGPLLDPVVREKIHIWGPKEWPTKIQQYVNLEDLPAEKGGKGTEWHPLGAVPTEFQLPNPY